jgi:putative transposase
MDESMVRHIAMNALGMVVAARIPSDGLIIHCDRGSQYISDDYQQMLK